MEYQQEVQQRRDSRRKETPSYLILNLSPDRELSLSEWSERDGITMCCDDNCRQLRQRKTYKRTLPPADLGRFMAKTHHQGISSEIGEGNFMNLMFHQWKQINWNHIASSYSNSCTDFGEEHRNSSSCDDVGASFIDSCNRRSIKDNDSIMSHTDHSSSSFSCSSASSSFSENDSSDIDRTSSLANEYGPELFSEMTKKMVTTKNTTIFQDFAMPCTFPFACIMSYAIQGQTCVIQEVLDSLGRFWSSYEDEAKQILTAQNDDEDRGITKRRRRNSEKDVSKILEMIFRQSMGWCGWYLFLSHYRMGSFRHVLPFNNASAKSVLDEDKEIVLDSIGTVGLKLMHWGFIDDVYDDSMKQTARSMLENDKSPIMRRLVPCIRSILQEEVDMLLLVQNVNLIHLCLEEEGSFRSIHPGIYDEEDDSSSFLTEETYHANNKIAKMLLAEEIPITKTTSNHHFSRRQRLISFSKSSATCSTSALFAPTSCTSSLRRTIRRRTRRRRHQQSLKTIRQSVLDALPWNFR